MSTLPVSRSRLKHYADKVAVSSEPGLTSAQLFLTNKDLQPGSLLLMQIITRFLLIAIPSGRRPAQMGLMELRRLLDC